MIVSSVCHASSGKDLIAPSNKEELLVLSQTGNKPPPEIQDCSEPSAAGSRGGRGFSYTFATGSKSEFIGSGCDLNPKSLRFFLERSCTEMMFSNIAALLRLLKPRCS